MKTTTFLVSAIVAGVLAIPSLAGEYTRTPTPERETSFKRAQQLITDATLATGTNRTAILADAQKTCDGLLWVQDDIFARTLVLYARVKFMQGETNRAIQILDEYKTELDKATNVMVTRGARTNDTPVHEAAKLREDIGRASGKEIQPPA